MQVETVVVAKYRKYMPALILCLVGGLLIGIKLTKLDCKRKFGESISKNVYAKIAPESMQT